MEKGMERGNGEEKIAAARRLLAMGLAPEQVARGSELPLEDVMVMM